MNRRRFYTQFKSTVILSISSMLKIITKIRTCSHYENFVIFSCYKNYGQPHKLTKKNTRYTWNFEINKEWSDKNISNEILKNTVCEENSHNPKPEYIQIDYKLKETKEYKKPSQIL